MNNKHNDDDTSGNSRSFDRDVFNLLFKYVFRYKKLVAVSFLFLSILTAAKLTSPLLTRYAIDRAIIKTGVAVYNSSEYDPRFYPDKIKNIISINDSIGFLFQFQLSNVSAKEIDSLVAKGVISKSEYILVKIPDLPDSLSNKVKLVLNKFSLPYGKEYLLLSDEARKEFTFKEMMRIRAGDVNMIGLILISLISLFILEFYVSYSQVIYLMKLSQNSMRDLRTDLYRHILSLENSFFDKTPVGKLVSRVIHDIESLNELFSSVLVALTQDILILSGITIVLFVMDVRLALAVCITFPPLVIATLIFRAHARTAYRKIRSANSRSQYISQ
jgi:ABC-type multidrug transport system fused ATPase/permease subunit